MHLIKFCFGFSLSKNCTFICVVLPVFASLCCRCTCFSSDCSLPLMYPDSNKHFPSASHRNLSIKSWLKIPLFHRTRRAFHFTKNCEFNFKSRKNTKINFLLQSASLWLIYKVSRIVSVLLDIELPWVQVCSTVIYRSIQLNRSLSNLIYP